MNSTSNFPVDNVLSVCSDNTCFDRLEIAKSKEEFLSPHSCCNLPKVVSDNPALENVDSVSSVSILSDVGSSLQSDCCDCEILEASTCGGSNLIDGIHIGRLTI